jgi:hypothetical protein
MHFIQDWKRMAISFAITLTMVTLCVAFGARPHHGDSRMDPARPSLREARRPAPRLPHGEHGAPWVKFVVTQAISVARCLGA